MEELLDSYIYYLKVERDFSPFTLRNYSSDILGFFNFLKMEQIESLKDVDHDTIRLYLGQILESGLARTSISRKVSSLRSFFRYLYFQGVIGLDPLVKLSAPKREKRLPSFLTAEDMINLLNAPKKTTPHGLRDLAILELLYASGLRISEIASLDLQNVDLTTKQVRVMGKGSKERIVLMGLSARDVLDYYIRRGRPRLLREHDTDALFVNRYGDRIAIRRIQYLIKKYANQAGISGRVHPHMLRHTFATHMLNGGADLRVVQELLGHENLSSTQIYTHVTTSQVRSRYLEAHPRSQNIEKTVKQQRSS